MENESIIPKTKLSSLFFALASLSIVIFGLVYFDSIFKPLAIAFLVWFMVKNLKDSMGKIKIKGKKIPEWLRSIMAFFIIFISLFFMVEILIDNLETLIAKMPDYISNFDKVILDISNFVNNPKYMEQIQQWLLGMNLSGLASALLGSLSAIVSNFAIVVVYVIFFLLEEATTKLKMDKLFPVKGEKYENFTKNMNSINDSIRSYISSKTMISFITGMISYFILLFMQVEYAFLWSFLIFILNFIPYIGPFISSLLPGIFAAVVNGDFMQFVYIFAAMEIVQIIIGNFIEPMIMGKGTNLGPIIVIIALAFWGMIWGIVGMVLAVPITSVIVIVLSQIQNTRYLAVLLSEKGNIPDNKL